MNVVQAIFALAIRRHYIALNPCDSVRLPRKVSNTSIQPLTDAEFNKLKNALPLEWQLPVTLAAFTGLRSGELWALRRDDFNLTMSQLVVDEAIKEVTIAQARDVPPEQRLTPDLICGPTKTHTVRAVSIPPTIRPMLTAHLKTAPRPNDPRAFIFTMPNGSPVRHGNFYTRIFRPAVKKALTRDNRPGGFRFHDLRHTCAAWLVEDGAHPLQIKLRLGHADIQTTMNIYGHLFPSAEDALADKLDARLRSKPAKKVVAIR